MSCGSAASGLGGALFLTFSSAALNGVLLGTSNGWTGVVSKLAFSFVLFTLQYSTSLQETEKLCRTSCSETANKTESHTESTSAIKLETETETLLLLPQRLSQSLSFTRHLHRKTFLEKFPPDKNGGRNIEEQRANLISDSARNIHLREVQYEQNNARIATVGRLSADDIRKNTQDEQQTSRFGSELSRIAQRNRFKSTLDTSMMIPM